MGLNSENARRLVFDIETVPLPEAQDYIEPADAPANYKDPAKIAAYVAEKNAEAVSKCGLDADLCQIVAIGWWRECDEHPTCLLGEHASEANLLRGFWNHAEDMHLVGFNCLGFDLPVLLRRSLYLGIDAPTIQIDRFRHPNVTDVMQLLAFNGTLKFRGLSFYAKRFGLEIPDTLTGADVAAAVAENRWPDVLTHVLADVRKTAALAERLGYFSRALAGAL